MRKYRFDTAEWGYALTAAVLVAALMIWLVMWK